MANNYFESTGVLVLGSVTPVITALFGDFDLDATYPGNGEVYIAQVSESTQPSWDDITENLEELAGTLGLALAANDDESVQSYLRVLAAHFGVGDDPLIRKLVDEYDFDVSVDLAILYALAKRFDDGHGLTSMVMEGCWRSEKPRLYEFGGSGDYYGQHVSVSTASSDAISLGSGLDKALGAQDFDTAVKLVKGELDGILSAIHDIGMRQTLRTKLAAALQ